RLPRRVFHVGHKGDLVVIVDRWPRTADIDQRRVVAGSRPLGGDRTDLPRVHIPEKGPEWSIGLDVQQAKNDVAGLVHANRRPDLGKLRPRAARSRLAGDNDGRKLATGILDQQWPARGVASDK